MTSGLIDSSAIVFPLCLGERGSPRQSLSARELLAKFCESGGDAAVDDVVGDLHAQAPDDGGVDHLIDGDLAPIAAGQSITETGLLSSGQRSGGVHGDRKSVV